MRYGQSSSGLSIHHEESPAFGESNRVDLLDVSRIEAASRSSPGGRLEDRAARARSEAAIRLAAGDTREGRGSLCAYEVPKVFLHTLFVASRMVAPAAR